MKVEKSKHKERIGRIEIPLIDIFGMKGRIIRDAKPCKTEETEQFLILIFDKESRCQMYSERLKSFSVKHKVRYLIKK